MSEDQNADTLLEEAAEKIAAESAPEIEEIVIDETPAPLPEGEDVEVEVAAEGDLGDDTAEIEKARKAGWRPKEEYKGNPKNWKDYKEFNAVGEKITSKLTSKIDNLAEDNRKQREMINKLIAAQGTIAKQAKEDAIAALTKQRIEAIEDGDVRRVEDIDGKLDEVKKSQVLEPEPERPKIDDAVTEFVEAESSWFNENNPAMVRYAVAAEQTERQLGNSDAADIMAKVKQAVMARFPDKFTQEKKAPARKATQPAFESGTPARRQSKVIRLSDFPKEVQDIANYFEKSGIMSKKDYLKQLEEGM
jgi:hypothetical protein